MFLQKILFEFSLHFRDGLTANYLTKNDIFYSVTVYFYEKKNLLVTENASFNTTTFHIVAALF